MNTIKRWYVSLYFTAMFALSGWGIFQIFNTGSVLPWTALAFTALPGAILVSVFFLGSVARTTKHIPTVQIPMWLALLVTAATAESSNTVAIGMGAVAGTLLYIYWYSSLGRAKNNAVVVGKPLPGIELEGPNQSVVTNTDFAGKPALLMFYRGNWCPLCMAQIKEIAELYKELDRRGVQVAMISPQSHDNTESLAKKFDVPFKFLVDRDNRVANTLEIIHKNGVPVGMLGYDSDAPYPTIIILDAEGKVAFADMTDNYRVRPEPDTFLKIIDEKGLAAA
ncbi:MAG: peroxiredoxin family protein [Gammaproteobacteria bacterium]|nr:peroxiredoxin family protein [Gammaproteobacteria bacterium]